MSYNMKKQDAGVRIPDWFSIQLNAPVEVESSVFLVPQEKTKLFSPDWFKVQVSQ